MFFMISNALKKRFVVLFQEIYRDHPIFNKVQVLTKFPEEERPKNALLIRSVSGSSMKLGMDNFATTNYSFCSLANLQGVHGNSVEWVKDDVKNADQRVAPGFYIVKITSEDTTEGTFEFTVSPYLVVDDEELDFSNHVSGRKQATVKYTPVNPDTDAIFSVEDPSVQFKRGVDYTIDNDTGLILFEEDPTQYGTIKIDYQVVGEPSGPFEIEQYLINNTAIPGVILAFGDRLKLNDEQVVIVEKEKRETALVYTGRWQMSVDLIGVSQDTDQQERLVDYGVSEFWARWQDRLVDEGINVGEFSLSGESEDLETELPDEYNFTGGITFTAETDWEYHVPLVMEIRRISLQYGQESFKAPLSHVEEAQYDDRQYDSRMVNSGHHFGLQMVSPTDPVVMTPSPCGRKTRKYQRDLIG